MMINDAMTLADVLSLFEEPNTEARTLKIPAQSPPFREAMIIYKGSCDVGEELEIERYAKSEGLIILTHDIKGNHGDFELPDKYRFLIKSEDKWRVPAYIEFMQMMKANYRWCDAAEHFERLLLGFEESDILDYLNIRRETHGFWGLQLVYVIMHQNYFNSLGQFGYKCFERLSEGKSLSLIFDSLGRRIKASVHSRAPQEYIVGRFGLALSSLRNIFDLSELENDKPLLTVKLENARIPFLNQALCTKLQFFSDGSWS